MFRIMADIYLLGALFLFSLYLCGFNLLTFYCQSIDESLSGLVSNMIIIQIYVETFWLKLIFCRDFSCVFIFQLLYSIKICTLY